MRSFKREIAMDLETSEQVNLAVFVVLTKTCTRETVIRSSNYKLVLFLKITYYISFCKWKYTSLNVKTRKKQLSFHDINSGLISAHKTFKVICNLPAALSNGIWKIWQGSNSIIQSFKLPSTPAEIISTLGNLYNVSLNLFSFQNILFVWVHFSIK